VLIHGHGLRMFGQFEQRAIDIEKQAPGGNRQRHGTDRRRVMCRELHHPPSIKNRGRSQPHDLC
jgi:hypothetical protein